MKRILMGLLVAGALMISIGSTTSITTTGEGPSTHQESTLSPSGWAVLAGSKPGVGVGSGGGTHNTGLTLTGSKPGLGSGSGGIEKNTGVELAGGRGGIGGDCGWDRAA